MITSQAQVFTDRRICQEMAHELGLRVEYTHPRFGVDRLFLWPQDGYAWELYDPLVASNWSEMRTILTALTLEVTLNRKAAA